MSRLLTTLALAPFAIVAAVAGGCNIVAPVLYAVQGPGEIAAAVKLEPEKTYTILIDDPANRVTQRRYRAIIGDTAQRVLLRKNLVADGNLIDTRSTMAMASRGTATAPMPIADVGEAVEADVVIYAIVSQFTADDGGNPPRPTLMMHVKLVDVATGERIWPEEPEGFPQRVSLPASPATLGTSRNERVRVEEALAEKAGLALGEMFYDVELPLSNRRQ